MTDPIADMLTRIRNALAVGKEQVVVPHSKVKEAIAKTLKDEGYITDFSLKKTDYGQPDLLITLKYVGSEPAISQIQRVSKPGRRVYSKRNHIKTVLSGHGMSLISTSKGIMTNSQARKQQLGGEVISKVW